MIATTNLQKGLSLSRIMPRSTLIRSVLSRRLADYYGQPSDIVVGRSAELTKDSKLLSSLLGEWHWRRVYKKIYEEREGQWLTPVELFQPHYSFVMGNFCAKFFDEQTKIHKKNSRSKRSSNSNTQFEITEVGSGQGTNANLILSYLKENRPDLYSSLTYTLVDSSPSLHNTQVETFIDGPHSKKMRFELKDLVDVAEGKVTLLSKSDIPTVVIGMEVLDNLPHDKIRRRSSKKIEQAEVITKNNNFGEHETFVPLSDPLLKMIIKTVPNYIQSSTGNAACWVPSVACGVLHHVITQRPNCGVVLADFDFLPPPDLDFHHSAPAKSKTVPTEWAEGSPIITDMKGKDHASYLGAPKYCDILFPTDFNKLASFMKRHLSADSVVRVEKQSQFLKRYGPEHVQSTKSWLTGTTPLLYDFVNCSVLTISTE